MQYLGIAAGLFGLDEYLKGKIEAEKPENFPRDLEGTGGRIRLYRNHNDGFCFGVLRDHEKLVQEVPLVMTSACAGILLWLLSQKSSVLQRLGFSLVSAGACSNLYDRRKRGYVVDYFSIRVKGLNEVVMNLGDLCIFGGCLLIAASELLQGRGKGHFLKKV